MSRRIVSFCIYILLWLGAFLHSAPLRAQEYRFEQLGTQQGLPSSEVYGLHTDPKGYIWAFTTYGIVKHNGERFVKVCANIPFHQSVIFASREDKKGNLFIANSRAEFFRIRNDSAFLVPGLEGLSGEIVKSGGIIYNFSIDDTSLVVSTNRSTYWVDLRKKKKLINLSQQYPHDTLVLLQRSATEYVACNPQINFLKTKKSPQESLYAVFLHKGSREKHKLKAPKMLPTRHYITQQGDMIYLMFIRELFLIHTRTGAIRSIVTSRQILNYSVDGSGNVWICFYKGGLVMYDKNGNIKKSYFEKLTITDVEHDHMNGIWISSLENGVFYCANTNEKHYDHIPSIGTDNITLLKASDSMLFVGTTPGNLTILNGQVSSSSFQNTGYENNDILDIIPYGGSYIIGTKNGVYHFNKAKPERLGAMLATCKRIFDFGDSILYITNHTVEHIRFAPFKQYHPSVLKPSITCAAYDTPGTLLLGTTDGLYTYHLATGELSGHALPERIIRRVRTDHLKNRWICTKGDGLYRIGIKNDTLHIPNLPSEFINDIYIRKDSIVIISTNTGLYYTLLKDIQQPSWINLYKNETLDIACYKHKIMVGTRNGLLSFEEAMVFEELQPGFYLRGISVNDKAMGNNDMLHLKHTENSIRFDFDYLDFSANKQLSWQLKGPLNSSGLSEQTELSFQNLSPGTYSLSVWPDAGAGKRSPGFSSTFTIQPAFWQTTGFYAGTALAAVLLTAFVVFIIIKTRERKRRKVFEIEKQLAEQKLTALKAQINPHFISNSLSAIQQLIHTEEIDKAGKYIAMFSVFIRRVLNLSDKVLVPLEEELKVIDLYIELEQLRFANTFSFIKTISPDIDVYYTAVPPLITQPLIENAIWHGLLQLKHIRQPVLTLSVYLQDGNVVIEIEDNGIGRDAGKPATGLKESKGTHLVKSRIENLNKIHKNLNASVHIHDLIDQNGMPAGTKVILTFNSII